MLNVAVASFQAMLFIVSLLSFLHQTERTNSFHGHKHLEETITSSFKQPVPSETPNDAFLRSLNKEMGLDETD
jgi:hypothetical protein